jgi:hypothetical protein
MRVSGFPEQPVLLLSDQLRRWRKFLSAAYLKISVPQGTGMIT